MVGTKRQEEAATRCRCLVSLTLLALDLSASIVFPKHPNTNIKDQVYAIHY